MARPVMADADVLLDFAEGAASIWQHLTGHQRELVGDRDLLMAGTALARGWPVLTRNRRHFKLTGVELLDPSQ